MYSYRLTRHYERSREIALRLTILLLLVSVVSSVASPNGLKAQAQVIPAFPGAEGWGAESLGGRGGAVYEVTNLSDSGPGSFRSAVDASGPRTVVFKVAGEIELLTRITIANPYITVAGQTAPGGGITFTGNKIIISTHDVIIRYIKWRNKLDGFILVNHSSRSNDVNDIIIDHCSGNGGSTNVITVFNTDDRNRPDIHNVTVQNCIIAENPSRGMNLGGTSKVEADGTLTREGYEKVHHISIHHNFFVHNGHRNPIVKSRYTEVINNVVYNWGDRIGGFGASPEADSINNYWLSGPMSNPNRALVFEPLDGNSCLPFPKASLYIDGNIMPSFGVDSPDDDNWFLLEHNQTRCGAFGTAVLEDVRRLTPLSPAPVAVTISPALSMFSDVVNNAGANARLAANGDFVDARDSVDQQFIDDFFAGTGPDELLTCEVIGNELLPCSISKPSFIDPGQAYADSDHDGMPDEWENIYGLDPNNDSDGPQDLDGEGYTNLEEFLNGTDPTKAEQTLEPTASSTPGPSPIPTASGTPEPSPIPTASPTSGPSLTPILIPTPRPTDVPGEVGTLIEAENIGLVGGATVEIDVDASNGSYVTNPTGVRSAARQELRLPTSGIYFVWVRMYQSDPGDAGVEISAGNFRDKLDAGVSGVYEWVRMETSDGSGDFGLDLDVRRSRVEIQLAKTGVRIDALYITDDPQLSPDEITSVPEASATALSSTPVAPLAAPATSVPGPEVGAPTVVVPEPTPTAVPPVVATTGGTPGWVWIMMGLVIGLLAVVAIAGLFANMTGKRRR